MKGNLDLALYCSPAARSTGSLDEPARSPPVTRRRIRRRALTMPRVDKIRRAIWYSGLAESESRYDAGVASVCCRRGDASTRRAHFRCLALKKETVMLGFFCSHDLPHATALPGRFRHFGDVIETSASKRDDTAPRAAKPAKMPSAMTSAMAIGLPATAIAERRW